MAFLTATANSFGARWFDEEWNAQFDSPQWAETLNFYVDLMNDAGPPGASSNGFNENLTLFRNGQCGMWIDATVAASFVTNEESTVADSVGFALAPDNGLGKRGNWLWAWSLAVPAGTAQEEAAKKFSINSADPTNPTVDPVPYVGVQFVAIPEFQGIATAVGQQFSAALAGQSTVEEALANAQALTQREMDKAGYPK